MLFIVLSSRCPLVAWHSPSSPFVLARRSFVGHGRANVLGLRLATLGPISPPPPVLRPNLGVATTFFISDLFLSFHLLPGILPVGLFQTRGNTFVLCEKSLGWRSFLNTEIWFFKVGGWRLLGGDPSLPSGITLWLRGVQSLGPMNRRLYLR